MKIESCPDRKTVGIGQEHPRAVVFLDHDAASLLEKNAGVLT